MTLLTLGVSLACNTQKKNCEDSELRTMELEQVLLVTQGVYHHYTSYLLETNTKKKAYYGLQLWVDVAQIDSLALGQNEIELKVRRVEDESGVISEVHIESVKYGIAWNIQVDSILNSLRK